MNKQELITMAIPYFEKNENIQMMYATKDGNFFHKEHKHYAFAHAKSTNEQPITITRADLEDKPETSDTIEINSTEYSLEGLKTACDEKEINYVKNIGLKKLAEKYEKETEKTDE